MITEREQIQQAIERFTGSEATDRQINSVLATMPVVMHLITHPPKSVDDCLRSLPDKLFGLLLYLAHEHLGFVDLNDLESWDLEFLFLTALLYLVETGGDASNEQMAAVAHSLARLTTLEAARRDGRYMLVERYSLLGRHPPRQVAARENTTGH